MNRTLTWLIWSFCMQVICFHSAFLAFDFEQVYNKIDENESKMLAFTDKKWIFLPWVRWQTKRDLAYLHLLSLTHDHFCPNFLQRFVIWDTILHRKRSENGKKLTKMSMILAVLMVLVGWIQKTLTFRTMGCDILGNKIYSRGRSRRFYC